MITFKKAAVVLLASFLCLTAMSCDKTESRETTADTGSADPSYIETADMETSPEPDTSDRETEPAPAETTPLLPDDAEIVGDHDAETEEETDAETAETEAPAETEEPRIYDYLNGKTVSEEEQSRRPVAIMLNNIRECLPQNSLTAGDFYYEFPVEGGITRIMMLVSDYENMDVVGSIRSSRDYFVDMLHTHNAIYVNAGGSPMAYDKLMTRGISYLDGVTMYIPDMFYRDQSRLSYMSAEHTLMTTGQRIANGIAFKGYETKHGDDFTPAFRFYDETEDVQPLGAIASHVHMNSTFLQTVDFVYDADTGEYLRYQYNGLPQVDGLTGEQLSVKNVIILFTDIARIPGDESGRLSIQTVGNGQGYYITNGRRKVITWSREHDTAPLMLNYKDSGELYLNSGKTFICIVDKSVAKGIVFDYQW